MGHDPGGSGLLSRAMGRSPGPRVCGGCVSLVMLEGMSTHKTALRTRPSTPSMRVRRLVAAVALAPLLAVAACSDGATTSTSGGASTGAPAAASTDGAQS